DWKDDPTVKYPTVYFIGGFGGGHRYATQMAAGGLPKIVANCMIIVLDFSCSLGHSVFADSENNGSWGKFLIEELILAVEVKYHGAQDNPDLRVVTGVSSGGWSSLWLLLNYPERFAGCWSYCPDPVDFRDFQRINLYKDHVNMYKDEKGDRR